LVLTFPTVPAPPSALAFFPNSLPGTNYFEFSFILEIEGNFDPVPKQLLKNKTSREKTRVKGIFGFGPFPLPIWKAFKREDMP
jgi:hypothetical protein